MVEWAAKQSPHDEKDYFVTMNGLRKDIKLRSVLWLKDLTKARKWAVGG
jgi:hypothetical protein